MATAGDLLKRILVGRQVASSRMEHTLLPKLLALPVFSSDALSSVAYATEEMMIALAAASAGAFSLMLPIGALVAIVLAIVVTSYRQTVRAYPQGGGSYIVARENLGTVPGLVAAAAILQDYVLTVAVSVTAGTVAIISAAPNLESHRVAITVVLVVFLALANLRGVREAGILFAIPTYGFVVVVFLTILVGLVSCLGGCPTAATAHFPIEATSSLTVFIVLKAFASGSTALTGVEAIADGVQAFRRPQARNAATTLAIMGTISITMFLGITYLAGSFQIHVGEAIPVHQSVLAQIGLTIYGEGFVFYVLQTFTALILIIAANTAYQDFPRLSAILARDGFVPRQFLNRGDRLVFSNGVVVLSLLAILLVVLFDADLTRLIQLYVVGVFTAFTLSQTGMVRRWMRTRGPGWRRSAIINGIGAIATGIVLVIVAVTKFAHGAWIVIAAVPFIVGFFLAVQRHYQTARRHLAEQSVRFGEPATNPIVLVLTDVDASAAEALGYIRSIRPQTFDVLYVGREPHEEIERRWGEMAPQGPAITFLEGTSIEAVASYVRRMVDPQGFVTVVIPEQFRRRSLLAAVRAKTFRLKVRLLREPGVVVTDVPVLEERGKLVGVDGRPLIPERIVALVFVSSVHDAAIRAVNYALSLNASDMRAIYISLEPEESGRILEEWAERGVRVPLDIVEAPFRDLGPPVLEEVRRVTADPGAVCAAIVPELVVRRWWHGFLHNNRPLFIKRLLLFEERVILTSVPFHLGRTPIEARTGSDVDGS